MKFLLRSITLLIGLSYPLLVYFGLSTSGTGVFGALLITTLVIRILSTLDTIEKKQVIVYTLLIAYSIIIILTNNELLLRFYPVIISLGLGLSFVFSVIQGEPLIVEILEKFNQAIPSEAENYLYWLTVLWGGLLIINALIAAYTACCLSLAQWALYNGLLSYIIFFLFFALEYLYRLWFKHNKAKTHKERT